MEKMRMESMDIVAQNVENIGNLFPDCITEARDENGKIQKVVDRDRLMQKFSHKIIGGGTTEHYEFTWVGKNASRVEANTITNKTLRPCIEESKDWDNTENLYIEGDNLEVLKLLQNNYFNKVKMIYIDPPYNTGKDFIYRDKFSQNIDEYEEAKGSFDEEGNRLFKNIETNGRFHSNWCSMIYPRLILARNLLTDDGIICVQIDDNEYDNMKKILSEVFGESNYLTTIIVKMSEATGVKMAHSDIMIPKLKEYIIIFKRKDNIKINSVYIPKEQWDDEYKTFLIGISKDEVNLLKKIRECEKRTDKDVETVDKILAKIDYKSLTDIYKIYNITKKEDKLKFNYENAWRIVQIASISGGAKILADNKRKKIQNRFFSIVTPKKKMYFIKGDYDFNIDKPRIKMLFADDYLMVNPCDFWQDIKTTGLDNEGFVSFRNGKKPLKLVNRLIKMFTNPNGNDIVMDFFAGSSTTAHAVLDMNFEDNGNRKFILVQIPVDLDNQLDIVDKDTKKDILKQIEFLDSKGLKHFITEIGKERIRLAGEKIKGEAGFNGQDLDIGFRVLKLDSSNMKDIYYSADEYDQGMLENMQSNIKEDRTDLDLLFGCLVDWGLELDKPYTTKVINGHKVHIYNGEALVACFEKDLDMKTIKEIAKLQALRVVFCDNSFIDSATKINVAEHFKMIAPDTDIKVI
ncbi:site-specific DNA-methyltransferase [Megamonas funiformis]|uniref:site-specific DNA-methyltransferase n=1 Tax=Megamonas funiformis TaxID=437897 RepID=UPI001CD70C21|nr:site-specific DNA-methyltransferase [Megamonas funiformis]UBS48852.1 site-specific DNA-methyltransferase [Megamonas funiformis]GLU99371.1 site-specific DNA-methyltransferase [Megamonas funiformis]